MKKYIIPEHNRNMIVSLDTDTLAIDTIRNAYLNVDYSWIIEEDGELTYNGKVFDVKRGCRVYLLYSHPKFSGNDREIIIVNELPLLERSIAYEAFQKEQAKGMDRCNECDCEPCSDSGSEIIG